MFVTGDFTRFQIGSCCALKTERGASRMRLDWLVGFSDLEVWFFNDTLLIL